MESMSVRARDVETRAAGWIAQQERADWNGEDAASFDSWLAQSLAHRVAYWRLNAAWDRTKRLAALRPSEAAKSDEAAGSRPRRIFARIAAGAAAIAVLAGGLSFVFVKPHTQTLATAVGDHRSVKLSDGSQIELNTDTVLRFSADAKSRTVWLDRGEAYFHVKHDAARRFTVISNNRSVTDLGTSFTVRRDAQALKVTVMQGRVLLDLAEPTRSPTLLTEGDIAVATANSLSVTKKTLRQLTDDTAWRRGVLVFDRVTLADAAAEFNRYNREKLVVVGGKAAQRIIGATFPIHDVEQFVDVTQDVLGLHAEKHGDQIVISR
jgi:transmembrane sensor